MVKRRDLTDLHRQESAEDAPYRNKLLSNWGKKTKTKIFISMPMAHKTDAQIISEFKNIKQEFLKTCKNAEFIDSIFSNFDLENNANTPIHYLGRSIELLADADIIYFAKGWQKARGCKVEHLVAELYGKMIKEAK